jgi:hypothetical protein
MPPYFNSETGALHDESADDHVADHVAPTPDERKPAEPTKPAAPSEAPPLKPGWPVLDTLEKIDAFRAGIPGDPYHPARTDPELMEYCVVQEWRLSGQGTGEPAVLGELFEGGRMRPPGADALSPAPRPVLPEGNAWDERALVLGEIEAHACGLAPHVVMQTTDDLARVIEAGVEWSAELGEAELIRRHGRDGAERMADRARQAYEIIVESEHPLLVRRVKELARDYGDDPNVVAIFAALYEQIRSAPPSPKLMALLERREHRLAQVDAAAHARRAKAQQAEEAASTAARDDALDQIGAQHRRWQSRS